MPFYSIDFQHRRYYTDIYQPTTILHLCIPSVYNLFNKNLTFKFTRLSLSFFKSITTHLQTFEGSMHLSTPPQVHGFGSLTLELSVASVSLSVLRISFIGSVSKSLCDCCLSSFSCMSLRWLDTDSVFNVEAFHFSAYVVLLQRLF